MGTHGVVIIRDGDWVWGFHSFSDGGNVWSFYEQNKELTDVKEILLKALEFYAEDYYSDHSNLNIYREKFKPDENYLETTHKNLYFDGEKWWKDD